MLLISSLVARTKMWQMEIFNTFLQFHSQRVIFLLNKSSQVYSFLLGHQLRDYLSQCVV